MTASQTANLHKNYIIYFWSNIPNIFSFVTTMLLYGSFTQAAFDACCCGRLLRCRKLDNVLSLQKRNCPQQSNASNTVCVNHPLTVEFAYLIWAYNNYYYYLASSLWFALGWSDLCLHFVHFCFVGSTLTPLTPISVSDVNKSLLSAQSISVLGDNAQFQTGEARSAVVAKLSFSSIFNFSIAFIIFCFLNSL